MSVQPITASTTGPTATSNVRRYNQLELVTEHLGYLPVRFTDDFYNACIGCMAKAVEGVEAFVSTLPGDERKKIEVKKKKKAMKGSLR